MCAIVGVVSDISEGGWGERRRLIESLLLAAEPHGPHATGFVAEATPFKRQKQRRIVTAKRPLRARDFVRQSNWQQLRRLRSPIVLCHTRWKTHGSETDNRNNHPFRSRDGRFHLVHNGVLSNHEDIDDRFELRRDGDCDSETILRLIEKVGDARAGMSVALRHLKGSLSVGLFDKATSSLWLANNGGRPMHVCKLVGLKGWVFGSTASIIHEALHRAVGAGYERRIQVIMPLAPFTLHVLTPEGLLIGFEPIPPSRRSAPTIPEHWRV